MYVCCTVHMMYVMYTMYMYDNVYNILYTTCHVCIQTVYFYKYILYMYMYLRYQVRSNECTVCMMYVPHDLTADSGCSLDFVNPR